MAFYLIEYEICGKQYTGSTKTNFRSRANNYKSTQRKFVDKEVISKQALKQKRFHEHYCSDRHNGTWCDTIHLVEVSHINKSCILGLETYLVENSGPPSYPFLG